MRYSSSKKYTLVSRVYWRRVSAEVSSFPFAESILLRGTENDDLIKRKLKEDKDTIYYSEINLELPLHHE
jgi:hypothetical protein